MCVEINIVKEKFVISKTVLLLRQHVVWVQLYLFAGYGWLDCSLGFPKSFMLITPTVSDVVVKKA